MCGIFLYYNKDKKTLEDNKDYIKKQFQLGSKRGPENSKVLLLDNYFFGFHRLAINGLDEISNQPFDQDNVILICNGEIYNHKELFHKLNIKPTTNSDCEIIIHLYKKYGIKYAVQQLDGVFAFILYDKSNGSIFVGRDPYGVRPLYFYRDYDKFIVASELKQIVNIPNIFRSMVHQFLPGSYVSITSSKILYQEKYIEFPSLKFIDSSFPVTIDYYQNQINTYLRKAVKKRVENCERPVACLLSGGLDSSLITALVAQYVPDVSKLETYSIGLEGSEDLKYAKIVADFLGTKHTQITLTEDEFFGSIPTVIHDISSFDTTTVRASVGNYLIGKYISENSDAKVIFNGDGSDELAGGYLYFHNCKTDFDFDYECKHLLKNIHYFDVLRSDRSISSHGLEARTPFLDKSFVDFYLNIPIEIRNHNNTKNCEKYLIRSSFADVLPKEILWRTKEAFSDGVSSLSKPWYEIINSKIKSLYGINFLDTKIKGNLTLEQKYYLDIFRNSYSNNCDKIIPYYWMPKWSDATDSSARTLNVYSNENSNLSLVNQRI